MGHHNCKDIISKVFLILDGELSIDEEKEFLNELNCCTSCLEKYNIERSFKSFLCAKINKKTVSIETVSTIKAQLNAMGHQGESKM